MHYYVDLKVVLPDEIQYYEVKTGGFAEECIMQGIGQLLAYINYENDSRRTKMIVFGKNKPTNSEIEFIEFLKRQFQAVNFEYLSLNDIERTL